MENYIGILNYYSIRNYSIRLLQFTFWFLSYTFSDVDEKKIFEKLSDTCNNARIVMNSFSILENIKKTSTDLKTFYKNSFIKQISHLYYFISLLHISIQCYDLFLKMNETSHDFTSRLYNLFYVIRISLGLIISYYELNKNNENVLKKKIIANLFTLPVALNGAELIKPILKKRLNSGVEGALGMVSSMIFCSIYYKECRAKMEVHVFEKNKKF